MNATTFNITLDGAKISADMAASPDTTASFTMKPTSITWITVDKKPTEIKSTFIVDTHEMNMSIDELDRHIKEQLANDIARKLIEEDLLDIKVSNNEVFPEVYSAKASLKVIQE